MRIQVKVAIFLLAFLVTAACSNNVPEILDPQKSDYIDKDISLSRDDYRHMSRPLPAGEVPLPKARPSDPSIPDIAQVLAAPRPPKIGEAQLVSIAVTDDVPLKDVLIELARLADVDIELDAGIVGGISFRAKDKPFNEVIDRIANLAGLRYTMKNGVLRVERDTPYIQSYPIDFLNQVRSSDNQVNITTNVLSSSGGSSSSSGGGGAVGGGGSGGLNSGSSSSITAKAEGDFWQALENGIQTILNYRPISRLSALQTSEAEILPASVSAAPGAAAVPPTAAAASANAAAAPAPVAAPTAPAGASVSVAPPGAAGRGSSGSGVVSGTGETPFYIINRQAGVITISATQNQHELIRLFLEKISRNASAQVLLEAKIVEVTLSDQFASGINWSLLDGAGQGIGVNFASPTVSGSNGTTDTTRLLTLSGRGDVFGLDLDAIVRLTEQFGTVRTLSSPRLHAMNNQQAVLTFAQNQVFFDVKIDRQSNTAATTGSITTDLTVDSEVRTVPIGIILTMQPSINSETNEVTLNVRPTLSRVTGTVADPAVAFLGTSLGAGASIPQNNIPIVEVRELDSILKLKSGQVMVIGGLMEGRGTNSENGVPVVSDVPVFGNLFKAKTKNNTTRELIIFIRATIVGSNGFVPEADKNIYQKFSDDPRPIAF